MSLIDRIQSSFSEITLVEVAAKVDASWEVLGTLEPEPAPEQERGEDDAAYLERCERFALEQAPVLAAQVDELARDARRGDLRVRLMADKRILRTISYTVLGILPSAGATTVPKDWPTDPVAQLVLGVSILNQKMSDFIGVSAGWCAQVCANNDRLMDAQIRLIDSIIPVHVQNAELNAMASIEEEGTWEGAIEKFLEFVVETKKEAKEGAKGPIKADQLPMLFKRVMERVPAEERPKAVELIKMAAPTLFLEKL